MAVRKKFNIKTCEECLVAFDAGADGCMECRLNPPQAINEHYSTYPVVRKTNPACFAGIAGSMPKPKGKKNG